MGKTNIYTLKDEIKSLKARIVELEGKIVELETKYNTMKSELDNLSKILDKIVTLAASQKKLIEQMNMIIVNVEKLAKTIARKKGIWWG